MRACVWFLLALGCSRGVTGTVVKMESVRSCPEDRPITAGDLDCICGISSMIIDTTLADQCDELWCRGADLELDCVRYGTTEDSGTEDSGYGSTSYGSSTYGSDSGGSG